MLDIFLEDKKTIKNILDLGCGDGKAFDWLNQRFANIEYLGIDIQDSPEVHSRKRTDCIMKSYNGMDIPVEDGSYDMCFSNQVFEHVRYPDKVLAEIYRVLRPGGFFIGSLSYLEPYHSYSIFNFTPYGWYKICSDNGLNVVQLAGGVDGISMINRSLDKSLFRDEWWGMSPLNNQIINDPYLSIPQKNLKILLGSAHVCFICRKSEIKI